MTDITVDDKRLEGDSSLTLVPRCHTLADLEQHFGVQVDRSLGWDAAPPGQPVFKLAGFSVRTGPSFFCQVNKNGQPFAGVLICAWYPNFKAEPTWAPVPAYHSKVFGDFTNAQGVWGLPIGGLLIDVDSGSGGPVDLWPNSHPDLYADAAKRIGWYPATDHLACHPEWEYVVKEGGNGSTGDYYLLNVDANGNVLGHMTFTPGSPPPVTNAGGLVLMKGDEAVGYLPWKAGGRA